VLGIDRDPDAGGRMDDPRLTLVPANYRDLTRVLGDEAVPELSAALFDLGVSSHQLERRERGFSYRQRGPLDMRMGPDASVTADVIVNEWPEPELARIIRRYGEDRYARRIAAAIVRVRPVSDTTELAEAVAGAVPAAARRKAHPARRTFQAIRIEVNDELAGLRGGLDAAIAALRPGGRIAVISYHSLEDRIVKRRLALGATGCVCPPDLPVCGCGRAAELRLLTRKPLRPTEAEVEANPRSRSARLRAAERVGEPA
jgi:16S rRNA (cytosine1402-N4)-methyltransferase